MAVVEAKLESQEGTIREFNQLLKDHWFIAVAVTFLIVCVGFYFLAPFIKACMVFERSLRSNRVKKYPNLRMQIDARSELERRNEVHSRPLRKHKIDHGK